MPRAFIHAAAIGLALLAIGCAELTGLPPVPETLTAAAAGVDRIDLWVAQSRLLRQPFTVNDAARIDAAAAAAPIDRARLAIWLWSEQHEGPRALDRMRQALSADPTDMVIGNACRMLVYDMQRSYLADAKRRGERNPPLPKFLSGEPLTTLQTLAATAAGREIRLQIALAYVDRMVLYPALEIKAPASIDSVRMLTSILQGDDRHYLPALFARGLNYLHRPRNLVWPEKPAPAADAASRDLGLAAAVGAQVGGAPDSLRGLLLMTLGDAHAHQGEITAARSWWLVTRESCSDDAIRDGIALRMGWRDAEVPERLEQHLAGRMDDQDRPLSDLSFLWDDGGGRTP